jgi:transcriptional regulator of acetoin/glycerol metabolism
MERDHIVRALRKTHGNKTAAALLLGLNRKTLYRKIAQFRIDEE